jgi:phosphoribosyl-ATP pyrophosphohydrolase/phosphoribosyl-AMP cyclohydrolase
MPEIATWDELHWDERGLLPAVVQDDQTEQVLMVAWMDRQALQLTLERGETYFWSRSRRALWHKGETSGNTQRVTAIHVDCDGDTLLLRVRPAGPACHTGAVSCFYRALAGEPGPTSPDATRVAGQGEEGERGFGTALANH